MTEALIPRLATPNAAFLKLFNRLCVAFRETPDETGATPHVYFSVLSDLPLTALAKAADVLMRDTQRRFFPRAPEWREVAETIQREEFRLAVQPAREEPWRLDCGVCEDTGWEFFECPGNETCGRSREHAAHHYVRPCTCRPSNRTYQRHNTFGVGQ